MKFFNWENKMLKVKTVQNVNMATNQSFQIFLKIILIIQYI